MWYQLMDISATVALHIPVAISSILIIYTMLHFGYQEKLALQCK